MRKMLLEEWQTLTAKCDPLLDLWEQAWPLHELGLKQGLVSFGDRDWSSEECRLLNCAWRWRQAKDAVFRAQEANEVTYGNQGSEVVEALSIPETIYLEALRALYPLVSGGSK